VRRFPSRTRSNLLVSELTYLSLNSNGRKKTRSYTSVSNYDKAQVAATVQNTETTCSNGDREPTRFAQRRRQTNRNKMHRKIKHQLKGSLI
jgi:hypothetical protein